MVVVELWNGLPGLCELIVINVTATELTFVCISHLMLQTDNRDMPSLFKFN